MVAVCHGCHGKAADKERHTGLVLGVRGRLRRAGVICGSCGSLIIFYFFEKKNTYTHTPHIGKKPNYRNDRKKSFSTGGSDLR